AGEPLFVCQYRMARGHWQIVKHRPDGSLREGGSKTFELDQAPRDVIDIAVRAAKPIGDGFYGVDLKQTDDGIVVMEVNDNPNLEHGIEDAVGCCWLRVPAAGCREPPRSRLRLRRRAARSTRRRARKRRTRPAPATAGARGSRGSA